MQTGKNCPCTISCKSAECKGECNKLAKDLAEDPRVILIEKETKLEPRFFRRTRLTEEPESEDDRDSDDQNYLIPESLSGTGNAITSPVNGRMALDSSFQYRNRKSVNQFDALKIGGESLTGLTIGGFEIDLNAVADKVREVLPLPPTKLPVIFIDKNLNFYHHFFQGMMQKVGSSLFDVIVQSTHHYDDEPKLLLQLIDDLVIAGYERSDTEIMVLLKRVFSSTFAIPEKNRRNRQMQEISVVANLWGFQYIEAGMKCNESDLRMWLSMNYNHYKTLWFNTFKSTGVPSFATHGVSRFRSSNSSMSSQSSIPELVEEFEPTPDYHRSSRRRSKRGPRSTISSAETHDRRGQSSALARFLTS